MATELARTKRYKVMELDTPINCSTRSLVSPNVFSGYIVGYLTRIKGGNDRLNAGDIDRMDKLIIYIPDGVKLGFSRHKYIARDPTVVRSWGSVSMPKINRLGHSADDMIGFINGYLE